MIRHKTVGARHRTDDDGPRKTEQLGSGLGPTNNLNASPSQAPCPAGTAGDEDDWQYFRARPGATTRTRFPLPNEFPDDFLEHGGAVAFVRVAVTRDDRGQPAWAARSVRFCSGGNA